VPFGVTFVRGNRWVLSSSLTPREEPEAADAPQFNSTTGASAKPVRVAFGALFIKQRLAMVSNG